VWGGTGARLYDHDDHHHALTTKGMAAPRRHALLRLQESSEIDAYAQVKHQDGVFSRPPTGRHGIQIRPPVVSLPT